MLKFLFLGWALILIGQLSPDLFRDGFEGPEMHISTDRPASIPWSLLSSPSGDAAVVNTLAYLSDGLVGRAATITWDTGGGSTTADGISFKTNVSGTVTPGAYVIAVLFPKTANAPPPGVLVTTYYQHGMVSGGIASARTVMLNSGAVAAIMLVDPLYGAPFPYDYLLIQIADDLNGSTWTTPGQSIDVGEIWFGTLREFKTTLEPQRRLADTTQGRRAHSPTAWQLYQAPFKTWTAKITPIDDAKAFDSSSSPSFDSVRYALGDAQSAMFLPRIYVPGTNTVDPVALNQLACFGLMESITPLQGTPNAHRWQASLTWSEAPP